VSVQCGEHVGAVQLGNGDRPVASASTRTQYRVHFIDGIFLATSNMKPEKIKGEVSDIARSAPLDASAAVRIHAVEPIRLHNL
jgi:hypothetical protein